MIRVIEYENKRVDKLYLFIDGINHEGYYSPCCSDNNCLSSFPFPRIFNKITYLSSNGTALDLLTSINQLKKSFHVSIDIGYFGGEKLEKMLSSPPFVVSII